MSIIVDSEVEDGLFCYCTIVRDWGKVKNCHFSCLKKKTVAYGVNSLIDEPEPHWWETSALTTTPSLYPTLHSKRFRGVHFDVLTEKKMKRGAE